jgi:hypothetical protein
MEKNTESKIDLSEFSILAWIFKNEIKNEKGELLDFSDRLFLLDILRDWSQKIVIKKCAQVGGSVTFNLKVLYAIDKKRFNIIYTFPTDGDVSEFVNSKTNKLIQANPQVFGSLPTDNVERKEMNGRFLFFKGTVSKTAPIMTSADVLVHDEVSRSDQKILGLYKSRTKASSFKGRWLFSNPTIDKDVLDLEWNKSDKKEWHITCEHCKKEQIITWPDSIDKVNKTFICKSCKKELDNEVRRTGHWKKTGDGEISGYHISLLMAPWISASEIIEDSEGDQEYFYNFVLGEPYNPGDLRVDRSLVLDCWTPKLTKSEQMFMGVDVGNVKHYVLGNKYGLFKCGTFAKWYELDDLIKSYNPITVIDAMPENTMSREYTEKYQGVYMCYLNRDKSQKEILKFADKDNIGIIHSDRNRTLDQVVSEFIKGRIEISFTPDKFMEDYIKHWESLRRKKEVSSLGIERYAWESTNGVDHYCFATLFYWIARQIEGSGIILNREYERPDIILNKSDGQYANLEEVLRENDW